MPVEAEALSYLADDMEQAAENQAEEEAEEEADRALREVPRHQPPAVFPLPHPATATQKAWFFKSIITHGG